MNDKIVKEHHFQHPIGIVWDAISQGNEISSWFIQADFKPEVGYEYTFTHEQTKITGKVLKANPVYELSYTWVVSGTDVETTVSWKLEKSENGTKLILEHSGISMYSGDTAVVMFNNFKSGWDNCVDNLDRYIREKHV